MAQTVAYWQNKMLEQIAGDSVLSEMNSPSQVAIYRLITFVVATLVNMFEQTMDIFKTEVEDIAAKAAPGTPPWLQDQVFKFQYDATTPQVVQLVEFVPGYDPVDTTKRIITRCSVKTDSNKIANIKVAKSDPPTPLSTLEQNALNGYLDKINPAGVEYNLINLDSDKIQIYGTVYYDGQYSPVIQTNVEAAINEYLKNLPFNGVVKNSEIEDAIQGVNGVTDVLITAVKARRDTVAAASALTVTRVYETSSGYIVAETTASYTFADTLTYTAES